MKKTYLPPILATILSIVINSFKEIWDELQPSSEEEEEDKTNISLLPENEDFISFLF